MASLSGADLSKVSLNGTVFRDVDLSQAKGLDDCRHDGPSIIDNLTLSQSPNLPLSFLRGVGLSDWEIETTKWQHSGLSSEDITTIGYAAINARQGQPALHLQSCFISYTEDNEDVAKKLHADLQNKGVRCWFAPVDLKIGDRFRSTIDVAIHHRDRLLCILSEQALASTWVEREVTTALQREDDEGRPVLFQLRIDSAVMQTKTGWAAEIRRTHHIGDLT